MFLFRNPGREGWGFFLLCLLGFSVLAVPFGMLSGFYRWTAPLDAMEILRMAAIVIVIPAIGEELVFRGPLIWLKEKRGAVPVWAIAVSLIAFIAWHPINAYTFMPQAREIFLDPRFLFIAALLGVVATLLALRTRSLWPPILFHWALVLVWKVFLGAPAFL